MNNYGDSNNGNDNQNTGIGEQQNCGSESGKTNSANKNTDAPLFNSDRESYSQYRANNDANRHDNSAQSGGAFRQNGFNGNVNGSNGRNGSGNYTNNGSDANSGNNSSGSYNSGNSRPYNSYNPYSGNVNGSNGRNGSGNYTNNGSNFGSYNYGNSNTYNSYNPYNRNQSCFNGSGGNGTHEKVKTPFFLCLLFSLMFSLVFGLIGTGIVSSVMNRKAGNKKYEVNITSNSVTLNPDDMGDIPTVTKKVIDSVVSISVITGGADNVSGSGVIISEDGFIITCNHVVSGADSIRVQMHNGTSYTAKFIGGDQWSDIAVIKVDGITDLPYSKLATAAEEGGSYMYLGETVVIIGNPLGELPWSVSSGIISGLDREITVGGIKLDVIQTTAAINPGNSGGAMFDLYGNLIGIVNAKTVSENVEGIGFAIPSDVALDISKQLIESRTAEHPGYVSGRPYIGLSFNQISKTTSDGTLSYLQVAGYDFGSELEAQGKELFSKGDIILTIDGIEVSTSAQLLSILSAKNVGDVMKFTVYRSMNDGTVEYVTIEVTVHKIDDKYSG